MSASAFGSLSTCVWKASESTTEDISPAGVAAFLRPAAEAVLVRSPPLAHHAELGCLSVIHDQPSLPPEAQRRYGRLSSWSLLSRRSILRAALTPSLPNVALARTIRVRRWAYCVMASPCPQVGDYHGTSCPSYRRTSSVSHSHWPDGW